MTDQPVAALTINLPPDGDGGGGGVPMPDLRPLLSNISTTLEGISTSVGGLLVTTRQIAELVARVAGRGVAVSPVMAARVPRAPGDLTDELAALFPRVAPPPVPAPPRPTVPPPARPGEAGRRPGSSFAPVLQTPGIGGFMGMRIPFAGVAGPLLGPALIGVGAMRLVDQMGDGTMRKLSRFSPEIAGMQAQVEMNRWMKSYEIANSPAMQKIAAVRSGLQMRVDTAMAPFDAFMQGGILSFDSMLKLGFLTSVSGTLYRFLFGPSGAMAGGPSVAGNGLIMNELNHMVGGLLRMQETPIRQRGRDRPTRVRWNGGGWERSVIR